MAASSALKQLTEKQAQSALIKMAKEDGKTIISASIRTNPINGDIEGRAKLAKTSMTGEAFIIDYRLKYGRLWLSEAMIHMSAGELAAAMTLAQR